MAFGYEDGIEYVFYRRTMFGKYRPLLRVIPLLADAAHPGELHHGYGQELDGLADAGGATDVVQATFVHAISDDANVDTPAGQRHVPAVLFVGHAEPGAALDPLPFEAMTLRELRRRSRQVDVPIRSPER